MRTANRQAEQEERGQPRHEGPRPAVKPVEHPQAGEYDRSEADHDDAFGPGDEAHPDQRTAEGGGHTPARRQGQRDSQRKRISIFL